MTEPPTDYGLSPAKASSEITLPEISYSPPQLPADIPGIGIVGCGGISESHLKAYQHLGLPVLALADRNINKAQQRRDAFFPDAQVALDYKEILANRSIDVVDLTPHPEDRLSILEASLNAGKHVLSQKPFVIDLNEGERLVQLADDRGLKLGVNQNGRWAPHFSYMREAVSHGLIGEVVSIDFSLQWDQTWIAGIPSLERIEALMLYDFGIHWFDLVTCLLSQRTPQRVFASVRRQPDQAYAPPALAAAIIDYCEAQVRINFNGHTRYGEQDVTTVVGTKGTLRSSGPGLNEQGLMEVFLEQGYARVPLRGCWFEEGFQGTMSELLCSIDEDREPVNSARENLISLGLCFAAVESSLTGTPVPFGQVRKLPAAATRDLDA